MPAVVYTQDSATAFHQTVCSFIEHPRLVEVVSNAVEADGHIDTEERLCGGGRAAQETVKSHSVTGVDMHQVYVYSRPLMGTGRFEKSEG